MCGSLDACVKLLLQGEEHFTNDYMKMIINPMSSVFYQRNTVEIPEVILINFTASLETSIIFQVRFFLLLTYKALAAGKNFISAVPMVSTGLHCAPDMLRQFETVLSICCCKKIS